MTQTLQYEHVELRGAVRDLARRMLTYKGPPVIWDIMVEGPRGTGKSRQVMQLLYTLVDLFPGSRGLLCRNKRHSMSGTTLPEWEKCLAGDVAKDGTRPEGRSVYRFEREGGVSHVYVAGLDEHERLRSFTLDWVYYEEGTESYTNESWDAMRGTLRSWKMPFQFIITTVNPKQKSHWLNKAADDGIIERHKTYFRDNPVLFDNAVGDFTPQGKAFVDGLKRMTGHRYRRDYLGEWCAAEGVVFDEYDPDVHIIDGRIEKGQFGHVLHVPKWNRAIELHEYVISMDFGYRAPGVLQVWGVNGFEKKVFLVAEVYQPGKQLDWWSDVIHRMREEFPFETGVADSAEPRTIDFLNDRCRDIKRGRNDGPFIRPADKAKGKQWGLDQMRWGFSSIQGGPRTFILKDSSKWYPASETLVSAGKATCLPDELPDYVWREPKGEKAIEVDEPDPSCPDHSIDAATYFHVYAWKRFEQVAKQQTVFKPGTMGHWLGDYETLGWDWKG